MFRLARSSSRRTIAAIVAGPTLLGRTRWHLLSVLGSEDRAARGDVRLSRYGAALAFVNVLTATFWLTVQPLPEILTADPPICWPIFEACHEWRLSSRSLVTAVVVFFGVLSVANAGLILFQRHRRTSAILLLALSALKTAIVLQDYRLILNQHYMATWVTITYFLAPFPQRAINYLIVGFYVWAGSLKLNSDWLSGAGLYGRHPLNMPESLLPAACTYVVILELVIVWGLLSRRRAIVWATLAQLILFHVASFWVVGFYYPILMFLLLSIVPLSRWCPDDHSGPASHASFTRLLGGREPWRTYALLAVFCAMQLPPRLAAGDSAVTGEGRLMALNMFDAPTQCRATVRDTGADMLSADSPLKVAFLQPRIACDPIVYWQAAKARCRSLRAESPNADFTLLLLSRRLSDTAFATVVRIPEFCSNTPMYSLLRHNDWIQRE